MSHEEPTTSFLPPLPFGASSVERATRYDEVIAAIEAVLDGEGDWTAAMATIACELSHAFAWWHWTGFYRAVSESLLIVGPYQGTLGCLRIDFARGVCGAAARTRQTQLVPDVELFPGHIACASSTRSEIVVPVVAPDGALLAVFDVDSNHEAAFDALDQQVLESLFRRVGAQFSHAAYRPH